MPVFAESEDLLPKHEIWANRWYENGVSNRVLTDYFGYYKLHSLFTLEVGGSLSLLEQWGPSLLGVVGRVHFPNARSDLALGIQHERWPTWNVTENRAVFYWFFHPIPTFNISFGFTYRSPQFGSSTLAQSLAWTGNTGEISILYRCEGTFFTLGNFDLRGLFWNYDHMRLFTSDNIHFTLRLGYAFSPAIRTDLQVGTAAKGISGGIVAWDQSYFGIGLTYEPK